MAVKLLAGEQVVLSSDHDILVLTNQRVRSEITEFGSSSLITITLDSVASCGIVTKSFPVLLLIAAAALLAAFGLDGEFRNALLLAAAVSAAAYFLTRRAIIAIASNGGHTIAVPAGGMSRAVMMEFLQAVDQEKLRHRRNA